MERSGLARGRVEKAADAGDPLAAALVAAWDEIDTLRDRLDARRTTMSVEEYSDYSGLGATNFSKAVRSNRVPHIHVGEKEGVTRIVVKAADDFFYQQAMGNIARTDINAPRQGRNVA